MAAEGSGYNISPILNTDVLADAAIDVQTPLAEPEPRRPPSANGTPNAENDETMRIAKATERSRARFKDADVGERGAR